MRKPQSRYENPCPGNHRGKVHLFIVLLRDNNNNIIILFALLCVLYGFQFNNSHKLHVNIELCFD